MCKKLKFGFILLSLTILLSCFSINVKTNAISEKYYLGGMICGFGLETNQAKVVGISDVLTEEGFVSPAKNSEINIGDVIISIDGIKINGYTDIEKSVKDDKIKTIEIERNNQRKIINCKPAKEVSGKYRLGVYVKDKINGLGTITYFTEKDFGSLGHPIVNENGSIQTFGKGNIYQCSINGIVKGERGRAGEIKGQNLSNIPIGTITMNTEEGVFGNISNLFYEKTEIELGNAEIGDASIYSQVDGKLKEYKIQIIKSETDGIKNLIVKIIDRELIALTGGIVQGMSGSPILQNGKLVGAITHVFINNPLVGYGIKINNMINASK